MEEYLTSFKTSTLFKMIIIRVNIVLKKRASDDYVDDNDVGMY